MLTDKKTQNKVFNKWNEWLELIYNEVTTLFINRYFFQEVQKMLKNNPKTNKPNHFHNFFAVAYTDSAIIRVRRQIKPNEESISIARLMADMMKHPQVLSRERYVALYKGSPSEDLADADFDHFSRKVKAHLDPTLIKEHNDILEKKAQKIETYADKRVAHWDEKWNGKKMGEIPKYIDLDECIDYLGELFKKYYLLLTGKSFAQITPTLGYDWQEIFEVAWLQRK